MRTEEWIEQEKLRLNKGMSKIDEEYSKTILEFNDMASNCNRDDSKKLSYLTGKLRKLQDEKTQNRGKIKIINKILEVKC